jgi:hypothetical protein
MLQHSSSTMNSGDAAVGDHIGIMLSLCLLKYCCTFRDL